MKLRLLSDLHMEGTFFGYEYLGEDVILLLGDIYTKNRLRNLLEYMPDNIPKIFICGNHEYYGSTFSEVNDFMKYLEKEVPNFHFLNNESFDYGRVSFYGGTMWTNFELYGFNDMPYVIQDATRYIADYRYITTKKDLDNPYPSGQLGDPTFQPWTINDTIAEYEKFNKGFDRWVKDSSGKTRVCLSHFLPSMKSVDAQFKGSILNGYFASNQENRIELVDYWLHGHTHSSCDYMLGECRVVCNPKGYGSENKNNFNASLILEV
jgi:calcineurin-like phosphoesterase family protein